MQPGAVHVGFALDNVHRRKLWQCHEAPEGQRSERVLDAVNCFLPEWFAEPNTEFFYVKPPPAGCQEMAQLMHHDQQIEENEDFQQDENDANNVQ